jgi:uncharacterized membrane protein YgcG
MSSRFLLIAAGSIALASCNTMYTHIGDEDPGMGEAVAYDAAVQTVNPTPVYSADSAKPGANGDVGAHAVLRYRTDQVKQPQRFTTTSGTGGGSGGGGGGSSGGGPH